MSTKPRLQLDTELRRVLNWGRSEKDIGFMLRECSRVYRDWVARRFLDQSQGNGDWEPLKPATIAQKKRKGSKNPTSILSDSGRLYKAIKTETILGFRDFPHFGMGTETTISRIKPTISIGIGSPSLSCTKFQGGAGSNVVVSRQSNDGNAGFYNASDLKYSNGMTTEEVAERHQHGTSTVPARPIFVLPPPEVMEKMASVVVQKMLEIWGNP